MWSDDLDNEMRRAAQDEGAGMTSRGWEKMEAMLDEHLPVEKKKRRFLFFWLFAALLLAGGSAYLLLRNDNSAAQKELANTSVGETPATEQPAMGNEQEAIGNGQMIRFQKTTSETVTGNQQNITQGETLLSPSNTKSEQSSFSLLTGSPGKGRKKQENDGAVTTDFSVSQNAVTVGNTMPAQNNTTVDTHLSSYNNGPVSTATGNTMVDTSTKKEEPPAKVLTVTTRVENQKTKKDRPAAKNKLSLLLSAGPDLSSIGNDKQGRWKMQTGVGLQYQFSKRFSLRTGFYASRKIYEVKPKDYNPPPYFWQYYPDMQKIDADCKVYEVPVTLVFDVTKNQKNNFYITAGSSTYIMNKEVYGYSYKDNFGYDRYTQRTAPEKSVAYFSTIGLSAGYSRQLSSRVSVSVEPYLKMPLSGIGYGKVKLTSAGALINAAFRLGKN